MAQVALMYWSSVLLKRGPEWWTEGSAVYYALSLEQFATPAGRFLLQFPDLLRFLTFLTLAIETLAPVLLFSPLMAEALRTASVVHLIGLQLGLLVCMHLGHFPLVAIVAVIGLLPTGLWSLVEEYRSRRRQRRAATHPLRIYYDGGCDFCRKMALLLRTFLLAPGTAILQAQGDPHILPVMVREHSWVVVDQNGNRYFRSAAMAAVLRNSMWWPVAWVIDRPPVRALADQGYAWIATHRSMLTRLVSPLRYRPLDLRTHWLMGVLAAFFVGYVLWWNLGTVSARLAMPDRYRWIGMATRTDQMWGMFAPYPLKDDGWYVIPGVLRNGRQVDVFRGGAPVTFAKPSAAEIAGQYRDERWRKYLMNLYLPDNRGYRPYYGRYLCRQWNEGRAADDPEQLDALEIDFMMRTSVSGSQRPVAHQKHLLLRHHCR